MTNLLPLSIAVRVLESDSARLDQVLQQYAHLAAHYNHVPHMMNSLEKRWAKMDQKLFLVAFVLHPARHFKHINMVLDFAYPRSVAGYAADLYMRVFKADAAEADGVFR